ncbi:hypothetical protein [Mycolicibacterium iranicum]|uniref:Uncharacterized protein n=1 Tax=Mycolicibacterium iranicum TaxID=912594 RepID=A0A178LU26_MYCIR|nr:hypothetical protein [Mycolicibacterium iranicum]OAN36923.1 hypothetical protein A4X20_06200 [Mycolicibacterium iranicum]
MTGRLLTTASTIMCPHLGSAQLMTADVVAVADGTAILLETDVHVVVGCIFTVGAKYSPCVRIEWTGGSDTVSIGGTPALVESSIGKCISAENAPQGVALVVAAQTKAVTG